MNYFAYGLQITANIPLPLLPFDDYNDIRERDTEIPDISITLHRSTTHTNPHDGQNAQWSITRDKAELVMKDLATFHINKGRKIDIHPVFPVDEQMIQLLIINSVLAILLFQRKMLVLHGSCVELDNIAVAFTGDSGAGKSLMAGTLCSRGHGLITDDISAIDMRNESPRVLPGYPMIKMLPRDSAMLGFAGNQSILLHKLHSKLGCRVKDSFIIGKAIPLRYIFILGTGKHRCITELSARESFIHLLGNSAPQIWRTTPDELHFSHLEQLGKKIMVCKFIREKNVKALPEHMAMIKEYCLSHQ